ncbi:MAG: TIGR01459 family HAD-type hydrolase [Planctomycetaceae bacterium]|nr:TIGR01459 family HAD-type hydrolase [Planctomycetaceae bacterium]
MTRLISSVSSLLSQFDVFILDQWGVLHNGTTAYPDAAAAMNTLFAAERRVYVLSNSGKRADVNLSRIADKGLPVNGLRRVVTSGEALWEDLRDGRLQTGGTVPQRLHVLCGQPEDAAAWRADATEFELADSIDETVDAVLLMGVADGIALSDYDTVLAAARRFQLPLICSNPDRQSPRPGGLVISPGALADRYEGLGGHVIWYGKPEPEVFGAVLRDCRDVPRDRILMVGDSLEHDIAGAQRVGVRSLFVRGGLHETQFPPDADEAVIAATIDRLRDSRHAAAPDFSIHFFC